MSQRRRQHPTHLTFALHMPPFTLRAAALAAAWLLLPVSGALAQAAKVLGPQSTVEQYPAPALESPSTLGLIDFPALISAPGANDAMVITPSLRGLQLAFVGASAAGAQAASDPVQATAFVSLQGNSRVDAAKRAALIEAVTTKLAVYRDLPLTLGETRFIQQDITEVYAAHGFPLMSVVVPPQEIVDGRLQVQINEFKLKAYRVEYGDGQGVYSETAPHRTEDNSLSERLDPLLAEPVLSKQSLDREVKRLNAGSFRQARVIFEPGKQLGETTALVQVDEKRPWWLQLGYNNHATKASGTHRYSLSGATGYLPFENHQLSWNVTVGDHIDEFENYSLTYTAPLPWGHTLTANANYSDTASSSIPGISSGSTTLQLSTGYQIPLVEGDAFSWDLGLTTFYKQFERESLFGGVVVGTSRFDSVQFVIDNRFGWKEATATNQFTFVTTLSLGGVTGRNTDADFQSFYNSASGKAATTHHVLNYARVQQLEPLLGKSLDGWSTETQLSWQLTGDELAGSDNFAVGGAQVLRAYPSSAVAGDKGWYAIQFLHAKPLASSSLGVAGPWVQQLAFSGFVEAGEGRFRSGRKDKLWDYGLQMSASFQSGLSLTASLAFAGKGIADTDKGAATFFISAQWRF
jgi:hemolysin activation/secretion protein